MFWNDGPSGTPGKTIKTRGVNHGPVYIYVHGDNTSHSVPMTDSELFGHVHKAVNHEGHVAREPVWPSGKALGW